MVVLEEKKRVHSFKSERGYGGAETMQLEPKPTKKKIGNDMKHNHVISSQEAKSSWQGLIKEDIPIYSKEFILNGILRQTLNWSADRIH